MACVVSELMIVLREWKLPSPFKTNTGLYSPELAARSSGRISSGSNGGRMMQKFRAACRFTEKL